MAHRIFIPALALAASALALSAPASAQLLGGSGGLGGGLGGTLGGTLGNPTGPIGGTIGGAGELAGSGRGEAKVDRRSGRVQGKGDADARGSGSVDGGGDLLGRTIGGNANGSGSASGSGSLDAQAVGTDYVGQTARGAVGTVHGTAATVTGTASGATGTARDRAGGALPNVSGNGAGSGAGSFQGGLGQLAAAGSAAATGNGMFAVEPGMPVTDPRGKVIGHVQEVRQTGSGVVQAVTVEVGDRLATLPAASFSGAGDVLVSGMTKGDLKDIAKRQESAPGQSAPGLFGSLGGAGAGSGVFQGSLGQLAAAGSGAASGNGMFTVASGMPVTDPRGKVIGHVQEVRQTGSGVVQAVTVEVGDRLATLPAASFSGAGDVLVSGMTKSDLKDVAKRQESAPGQPTPGLFGSLGGAGAGTGVFQGSLGQLAAAGSGAASGNGMFAVTSGMPVTDPRGKVIGHVQEVRQTGSGGVQAVTVEVGDRLATLPAASFNGSGNVLVSGMTKGEIKDVAERQEEAAEAGQPTPAAAPAAQPAQPAQPAATAGAPRTKGGMRDREERSNTRNY